MTTPTMWRTPPIPLQIHKMTWDRTNWQPYPLQREVITSRARNKVVAFGRRAGKSQTGGHLLVPEAYRAWYELDDLKREGKRREYWIVGPEYSDSEKEFRVFWDSITRIGMRLDHPGSYYNPESGEMVASLFDRRFIVHAKSAKYPGTLVGEGLSGAIFSEAAKLKPSVWIKYLRPTLADFTGWTAFLSTPEGKNWFYDLYMAGLDPQRTDWQSWRAPAWVNPHLFPGGVDEELLSRLTEARRYGRMDRLIPTLKMLFSATHGAAAPTGIHPEIWALFLDMSMEMFNQEEAAQFTEFVGRVLKDFDEELHVTDHDFNSAWATYAAVDYGFTNPFAWLLVQVSPDRKRIHILDEYYKTGVTTEEAIKDIRSRGLCPAQTRMFYPDPAEPDRTRAISEALQVQAYRGGSILLQGRIEWMRRFLKMTPEHLDLGHPERKPGLTISRKCVNTIREFNEWRYPDSQKAGDRGRAAPEEPMSKDNHCPEALGRLLSGLFGNPFRVPAQSNRTNVTSRRK
jgi:hypothetical protein